MSNQKIQRRFSPRASQRRSKWFQIRVEPSLREKVLDKCSKTGVPYSYIARKALEEWVKEPPEELAA